ncbi:MAG TPA: L,D-transpeptidase [Thermoanaerobaculia bacterium]|nr:L,D-transpeptidase [Thermoanaerobaculia bacterium]
MKTKIYAVALGILIAACSREEVKEKASSVTEKVSSVVERVTVPDGPPDDPAAREKERFDDRWRRLNSFREQQAAAAARKAQEATNVKFVTGVKETLEGLNPEAINNAPVAVPITGDVSGPSVLKTQVYLDRVNHSVGALDGRWGKNSAISLWWYQRSRGINPTGDVDQATFRALAGDAGSVPAVVSHNVTSDDIEGPFTSVPEDMYEKAKLDCLCYESIKEKLAEKFHATTGLLELLNPGVDLNAVKAGSTINVPNVRPAVRSDRPDIARIVVSLSGNTFNAFDSAGNMIFHAPTTVGSKYDPSPRESVKITAIAHDPHFHYQPTLFAEVPDDEPEANLQPGPNSPVGVVWMALSKPHYGIHGTSDPDSIGYASSHGCIRLTNWDAKEVAHRVSPGVQVEFVDTRKEVPAE